METLRHLCLTWRRVAFLHVRSQTTVAHNDLVELCPRNLSHGTSSGGFGVTDLIMGSNWIWYARSSVALYRMH
jgi:hypothetical protein